MAMEMKGSSRSWDCRRKEAAGISPRNSTSNVEEGEGDRKKRRRINVL